MGAFDALFRDVAELGTGLFTDVLAEIRRVREDYDEDSARSSTLVLDSINVKISPPAPVRKHLIDGTTVLARDREAFVAAKPLDERAGPKGPFDIEPTTEVQIFVRTPKREYRVIAVDTLSGGDEDAMYILQLRG